MARMAVWSHESWLCGTGRLTPVRVCAYGPMGEVGAGGHNVGVLGAYHPFADAAHWSRAPRCGRWRLSGCSAESGDGGLGAGGLDAVGLSWTSWDMIEKVRRAVQGLRGVTDAGRTERGFHARGNGESAGQRLF